MLDLTLRDLHQAVAALDNPDSLSILNIDEDLLDSPDTTLEYLDRCQSVGSAPQYRPVNPRFAQPI